MTQLTFDQIQSGLARILDAPEDDGRLELIVRRPTIDRREVLQVATLDVVQGMIGDSWKDRPSSRTADGSPHPDMQLTIMNARVIALLAGERRRWPLAGDQLFVDLDLSAANLPAGTRLAIGTAVVEVTPQPHTGCGKFIERFGVDAMKFVNSPQGRALNLRGINARVVCSGEVPLGAAVQKVPRAQAVQSMVTNRSIPQAAIIPVLRYPDVPAAVAWLCEAFGFAERLRIEDHRVQMTFGSGALVIAAGPPSAAPPTDPIAGKADSVMVRVADLDPHHQRAQRAGAQIERPPADYPYGERQYTAVDPWGGVWTFSQSIADVDPAEWGGTLVGDRV